MVTNVVEQMPGQSSGRFARLSSASMKLNGLKPGPQTEFPHTIYDFTSDAVGKA
jgi:hypothetical protein